MSDQPTTPSPLEPAVSPLLEAEPGSVNELIGERIDIIFNKNPKEKDANGNYILTDDDIRLMVRYYRQERQRFMTESAEKEAKASTPKARKPVPKSVAEALATSVDLL